MCSFFSKASNNALLVPCITPINDLVSTVFNKRTLKFRTRETLSDDLALEGNSLYHRYPFVVRGEAGLPLFISEKEEDQRQQY